MSSNVKNGAQPGNGKPAGTFAQWLLKKQNWWLQFAIVAGISIAGLVALGVWTYDGAPPVAPFVSSADETVIPVDRIVHGKELFHVRGLMSWGSFWGDGADRGPDFTADALHRTQRLIHSRRRRETKRPLTSCGTTAPTTFRTLSGSPNPMGYRNSDRLHPGASSRAQHGSARFRP